MTIVLPSDIYLDMYTMMLFYTFTITSPFPRVAAVEEFRIYSVHCRRLPVLGPSSSLVASKDTGNFRSIIPQGF